MTESPIDIRLIDGRRVSLQASQIPRLVFHRYTLVAIVGAFFALFILKPYEYLAYAPVWFSAPFLFFSLLATVVIFLAMVVGSGRYLKLRYTITLPYSILTQIIMMYVTDNLLNIMIGDPRLALDIFVVKVLFTALFSEIAFFFYFNFLYPKILIEYGEGQAEIADIPEPRPEPQVETQVHLTIGGHSLPLDDLVCIEAEQSHVKITMVNRTYVVRKKFSDCIAKLPEGLGKQVHRSYWVSYDHVADLQRTGQYSLQIVLKNGTLIPVSRGRTSEIEKWLGNFVDPSA